MILNMKGSVNPKDMAEEEEPILPAQAHVEYIPKAGDTTRPVDAPQFHGEAAVDIVAVHGLAAKYHRSWSAKQPDGTRYPWLSAQLSKDMPDARILVFEYQSDWYEDPVHTSLEECGAQLLRCLTDDRRHTGRVRSCPSRRRRPIIFIGHSFGGLVIKQAMILAGQTPASTASPAAFEMYENHRELLSCVAGIVFLGTPHRGSGFSVLAEMQITWGSMKSWFTNSARPNPELISILHVDSMMVSYIQSEFKRLCREDSLSQLTLYCYYELKPLPLPPHIVVNMDSACIENAYCRGMNANHMEMNKFHGPSDENYKSVLYDLQAIFHQAPQSVGNHFEAWKYGSSMQNSSRDRLQRKLKPSRTPQAAQFTKKLESYKSASYTCQWIHGLEDFQKWSRGSPLQNTLWIKGKAGSGKSVLAAYIIDHLRSIDAQPTRCDASLSHFECKYKANVSTVLYFFCGVDRASETPERMVGTLIHQLLLVHAENEEMFRKATLLFEASPERFGETPGRDALAKLFLDMATLAGEIYIIVDGLEENKDWLSCTKVLQSLAKDSNVRILISCQETLEIARELPTVFESIMEVAITDHSQQDIIQFSQVKTTDLIAKKPSFLQKESTILSSLRDGAQGMFQWVNAALSHLEEDVEDPDQIEESFKDIPSELRSTWERVFLRSSRKNDPARDTQLRIALQLLAVSGRPVTLLEIKNAISLGQLGESAASPIVDPNKADTLEEVAEREVPLLLGTLVDLSHSTKTAQLAHPSLLGALTSPDTSGSKSAIAKYTFSIEEAHQQIADICMMLCKRSTFVHANAFGHKIPFVEYAWDYWAYHLYHSTTTFQYTQSLRSKFDDMCFAVSGDAVASLDALCQFLSRPLRAVPGRFSGREYILALQRAQDALVRPIVEIVALRKQFSGASPGVFSKLDTARKLLPNPAYQTPGAGSILDPIHKTTQAITGAVKEYTGRPSAVTRLRVDEVFEKEAYLPKPAMPGQVMLDIARHLRLLTLRLAVDPVYSALILSAGGRSFSPLHLLIYTAQMFEQSGSFPYWSKMSPHFDLLESFNCSPEDPEFAPAKFVLQCFEWRGKHGADNTDTLVGRYFRLNRIQVVEPNPSGQQVLRVSTENEKQVRRLHGITGDKFYTAKTAYALFNPPEKHWLRLFTNPLAGFHMKKALMIEEHEDVLLMANPDEVMQMYAPESVRETPLNQFVAAIPGILRVYFVRWVVLILQFGARITQEALLTQFSRLQVATLEMLFAISVFARFGSIDPSQRLRYWYLVPGLFLFWLRSRYVPSFGAYYMPHTWKQFAWAWNHPAAYLDLQSITGFWIWLGTVFRVLLYNVLGSVAIGWSQVEGNETPVGMLTDIYGVFHALCTVERSLFGILTALATLVSCALVMMKDPDRLREMYKVSLFYWFNMFFSLFMNGVQAGQLQHGGGYGAAFVTAMVHIFMLFLFVYQMDRITRWLSILLTPITASCVFFWRTFIQHYILLAQVIGIGSLLVLCGFAFKWAHKFIWDPYDIDSSLRKLYGASRKARSSIFPAEYKQIGQHPLGDPVMLRRTISLREENGTLPEMTEEEKEERRRKVAEAELARLPQRPAAHGSSNRYGQDLVRTINRVRFSSSTNEGDKKKEE